MLLNVSYTLIVDGQLIVRGGNLELVQVGGGSGGSIMIYIYIVDGDGFVFVVGGSGYVQSVLYGGGGGGGRVVFYYYYNFFVGKVIF